MAQDNAPIYELDSFCAALDSVAEMVYNANRSKGFYDDDPTTLIPPDIKDRENIVEVLMRLYFGNKLMLMVGELAEAHEAIRKNITKSEHIPQFTGVEEEMADELIRLLDFAGRNKLRLAEATKAKLIYNQGRPYKHNKNF